MTVPAGLNFFTSVIPVQFPLETTAQVQAHVVGDSRMVQHKLQHLRFGHLHPDTVAAITGVSGPRFDCPCCHLFKAQTPTVRTDQDPPTCIGQSVHVDIFGPWKHPMPVLGHNFLCVSVDGFETNLADGYSLTVPNGTNVAAVVEKIIDLYQSTYRVMLYEVVFDNATYFDCDTVLEVCTRRGVRRSFTAPYCHWQLKAERVLKPMQRNASCMLHFANRKPSYFLFCCLYFLDILKSMKSKSSPDISVWEAATGNAFPYAALKIWGSPMYGFILPEKYKKLQDKSAPRSVPGAFVGLSLTRRTWCLVSGTRIMHFGVARINEAELIRHAPKIEGSYEAVYAEVSEDPSLPSHAQDFDAVEYQFGQPSSTESKQQSVTDVSSPVSTSMVPAQHPPGFVPISLHKPSRKRTVAADFQYSPTDAPRLNVHSVDDHSAQQDAELTAFICITAPRLLQRSVMLS